MGTVVNIFSTEMELFVSLADDFLDRAIANVSAKGEFTVVLSGGSTPKLFFDTLSERALKQEKIPWEQIKFFFGDERYLDPENPDNNYHMAKEHLFSKVPVLRKNIYPIPTQFSDPQEAARAYESTLEKCFHLKANKLPKFDLVYLGLGKDAHTASLLPESDLVIHYVDNFLESRHPGEKTSKPIHYPKVASLFAPLQNMYRISMTPPIINNAENIIFIVTGANKALAVAKVLEGPSQPKLYPAQLIQSLHNKTRWCLDQAAASQLKLVEEKK